MKGMRCKTRPHARHDAVVAAVAVVAVIAMVGGIRVLGPAAGDFMLQTSISLQNKSISVQKKSDSVQNKSISVQNKSGRDRKPCPAHAKKVNMHRAMMGEPLESRRLLSTVVVTALSDSGMGSLREAMAIAQAGDTIDLTSLSGTITLASSLVLDKALTFDGPGRDVLSISGNDAVLIFDATSTNFGGDVTFSDLTLTRGGQASMTVGVLDSQGTGLTSFERVNITDNTARSQLIGTDNGNVRFIDSNITDNTITNGQRMISSNRELSVLRSTIANNSVTGLERELFGNMVSGSVVGGLLSANGNASIVNSTIANNVITAEGTDGKIYGGLVVQDSGTLTVTNSTVAGNTIAVSDTGNIYGAAIFLSSGASMTMTNTIIADTVAADPFNVVNSITSGGNNLIRGTGRAAFSNGVNGDIVGTLGSPIDARMGTLSNNGGATLTVPLLANSPAINAGDDADAPSLDQRGQARVGTSDIGAFEWRNSAPTWTTTSLAEAYVSAFYSPGIVAADVDTGDTLTISLVSGPDWISFTDLGNGSALLDGTPRLSDVGTANVTVRVSDGNIDVDRTFSINITSPIARIDNGNLLIVNGTAGDDDVRVWMRNGNSIRVARNGTIRNFDLTGLTQVWIEGHAGSDAITAGVGTIPLILRGGEGNDTLTGSEGDDEITGDAGTDVINTGNGTNLAWGGDGNDTITGGIGADTLSGNAQNDLIFGGGGNDRLNGNGGNDRLFGEGEDDRLYGGDGNDTLDGGMRVDRLWGGNGNDLLMGKQSADKLFGEAGDDTLLGGAGIDLFNGGANTDSADADDDDYTPVSIEVLI